MWSGFFSAYANKLRQMLPTEYTLTRFCIKFEFVLTFRKRHRPLCSGHIHFSALTVRQGNYAQHLSNGALGSLYQDLYPLS